MIDLDRLDVASEQLRVYDVEQGAWEHESEGYQFNAKHVLFHLVKDMANKDFTDPHKVESAIAPDSVQYAIRLGRWTGQANRALVPTPQNPGIVRSTSRRFGGRLPKHQVAVIEATAGIADHLHDYDHAGNQARAENGRLFVARRAARLLLYSADLQAGKYKFDLFEAFDERLASLRERFGIPEPANAVS